MRDYLSATFRAAPRVRANTPIVMGREENQTSNLVLARKMGTDPK